MLWSTGDCFLRALTRRLRRRSRPCRPEVFPRLRRPPSLSHTKAAAAGSKRQSPDTRLSSPPPQHPRPSTYRTLSAHPLPSFNLFSLSPCASLSPPSSLPSLWSPAPWLSAPTVSSSDLSALQTPFSYFETIPHLGQKAGLTGLWLLRQVLVRHPFRGQRRDPQRSPEGSGLPEQRLLHLQVRKREPPDWTSHHLPLRTWPVLSRSCPPCAEGY